MKILGIIPARYRSTRFPAKPLADIAGKSMIQRVYEQAKKSKAFHKVVVATDHQAIFNHVKMFEGEVCMTGENHQSGTDRCYEALSFEAISYDYVINIQGDEPFIEPEQINTLANCLDGQTQLATLAKKITEAEELFNPNIVKVIMEGTGEAIYFSREAIPYLRGIEKAAWIRQFDYYKHIGIYAYRTDILKEITRLPTGVLEKAESLEQLRWIENGFKIKVAKTNLESVGIDTPEDLQQAIKWLNS